MNEIKLNIGGTELHDGGAGSPALVGFTNVDARQTAGVDVVADMCCLPEKWLGKVAEIRCSHAIEHINYAAGVVAVKHWTAVLRPGGLLRIYTPNMRAIAKALTDGVMDITEFSRNIFGNQTYALNLHRCAYDQARLNGLCMQAGLTIISENPRPNAYVWDMGVQAIKPEVYKTCV